MRDVERAVTFAVKMLAVLVAVLAIALALTVGQADARGAPVVSHRGVRATKQRLWEIDQRRDGRADARARRRASCSDQHYQRGYREGKLPCQCANVAAHPDGCKRKPEAQADPPDLCEFCKAGHNEKEEAE